MNDRKNKLQVLSQALKNNLKRRRESVKKNKNKVEVKNKISKAVLSLILVLFLASCSKNVESVGYLVNKSVLDSIKVNESSKHEVLYILGEPTTKSAFAPEVYYYMGRQYEQVAFLTPKLKEQKVISIEFNQKDIVNSIKVYDQNDANFLNYDADKIKFEGNKISAFKQVFENIGKFSSQAQKRAIK